MLADAALHASQPSFNYLVDERPLEIIPPFASSPNRGNPMGCSKIREVVASPRQLIFNGERRPRLWEAI